MSAIVEPIPNQAFEIVREQIGVIIEAERVSQIDKQTGNDDIAAEILQNTTVWSERFVPIQQDELFVVMPIFFAGDYNNQSVGRADGDYQFYIDCYGRSRNSEEEKIPADMNAARLLMRLVGMIRYIFAHPEYIRLGFGPTPNIVRRSHPGSIKRTEIERVDGATGAIMYRLILNVDLCEEINPPFVETIIAENLTTVEVNETKEGYQYSSNQS